jgi:hypothetical protein
VAEPLNKKISITEVTPKMEEVQEKLPIKNPNGPLSKSRSEVRLNQHLPSKRQTNYKEEYHTRKPRFDAKKPLVSMQFRFQ